MTENQLTELLDLGERYVRDTLITQREKQLTPFYHLVAPLGHEDAIVPCTWNSTLQKDIMVALVKTISRQIEAVAALFICEAWMVKQKLEKGEPIPTDYGDGPPPSEHPDRVEVVQIIATDGVNIEARMLEIKRDWKNKIVDLVADGPMSKADMYTGRMIDGIIPPRTIN